MATPLTGDDVKLVNAGQAGPKDPFKADIDEGGSPQLVTASPSNGPPQEELKELRLDNGRAREIKKVGQVEDEAAASEEREGDIYADKVLACSITNKDACEMCSA